jgi:hypothetical protein
VAKWKKNEKAKVENRVRDKGKKNGAASVFPFSLSLYPFRRFPFLPFRPFSFSHFPLYPLPRLPIP